ncbi:unnamed protein product [Clonostachys rosea]|uniref:Uncharacterized protein n=1 Tax=Bionectria ochroleuca TaxID=29856 RepID=A0ABY6UHC6_BIOOC|nr:unnamed protein product [Clonostachys rosea]
MGLGVFAASSIQILPRPRLFPLINALKSLLLAGSGQLRGTGWQALLLHHESANDTMNGEDDQTVQWSVSFDSIVPTHRVNGSKAKSRRIWNVSYRGALAMLVAARWGHDPHVGEAEPIIMALQGCHE